MNNRFHKSGQSEPRPSRLARNRISIDSGRLRKARQGGNNRSRLATTSRTRHSCAGWKTLLTDLSDTRIRDILGRASTFWLTVTGTTKPRALLYLFKSNTTGSANVDASGWVVDCWGRRQGCWCREWRSESRGWRLTE